MIIILSDEKMVHHEASIINDLFENDLTYFHIRKFQVDETALENLLKQIKAPFMEKVVLHTHHHLAEKYGIKRIHFSENQRNDKNHFHHVMPIIKSTSVHRIEDFNALSEEWEYAFLSPFFNSISKPGYPAEFNQILDSTRLRKNKKVQLVALGGINAQHAEQLQQYDIDGIALKGAIWQNPDFKQTYLSCKKIVQ